MGGNPPPGYLAYLDGEPVGWVGVAVRTETPRLMNSRTIPAIDDAAVWSIGCFRMFDAVGFRRVLVTDATSARLPRLLVRLDLSPGTRAPSGS
jgi:hypothetical protein